MASPFEKSLALHTNERSQLDLEKFPLIDMSLEEDSLLPAGNKAVQGSHSNVRRSSSVSAFPKSERPDTECAAKAITAIQEDLPKCQQVECFHEPEQTVDPDLPVLTGEPVLKKKKKKTGCNLRKSLAWDNAFLTEEGVLDSEELSLVNRTFQKLPHQLKSNSHKKPLKLLQPPMMPKIKFSSIPSYKAAFTIDSQQHQAMSAINSHRSSIGTTTESVSESSEQHVNNVKGFIGIRHGVAQPPLLSKLQADSFNQDRLMVPAHAKFVDSKPLLLKKAIDKKHVGPLMPGKKDENEDGKPLGATASERVPGKGASHVKAVMKDISFTSQSINAEANRCSHIKTKGNSHVKAVMKYSSSTSKSINAEANRRSHIKTTEERLPSMAMQLVRTSARHVSKAASTKIDSTTKKPSPFGGSGILLSRDKPSGLRMPSPKLGFFGTSTAAPQVARLCERTNGHGYAEMAVGKNMAVNKLDAEGDSLRNNSKHNCGLKLSAVSAKSRHELSEASGLQTRGIRISSSIPSPVHSHNGADIASMSVDLVHGSSRPSLNLSNRRMDSTGQVLQVKKNVQNVSHLGKTVLSQPVSSPESNALGQENSYPICQEDKDILQNHIVAQGLAPRSHKKKESGRICALETIHVCQENVQNVRSPAKKIVSQLISSTSHNMLGQENAQEGTLQKCMVDQGQNGEGIENGMCFSDTRRIASGEECSTTLLGHVS